MPPKKKQVQASLLNFFPKTSSQGGNAAVKAEKENPVENNPRSGSTSQQTPAVAQTSKHASLPAAAVAEEAAADADMQDAGAPSQGVAGSQDEAPAASQGAREEEDEETTVYSQGARKGGGVRAIPRKLYSTEFLSYLPNYARHKLNPLFINPDGQRAPLMDMSGRKTRAHNSRSNSVEPSPLPGGMASEEDEEDMREAVEKRARKNVEWEEQGRKFLEPVQALLTTSTYLPRELLEALVHITLNHDSHLGNISIQAAALLTHSLTLHPVFEFAEGSSVQEERREDLAWQPMRLNIKPNHESDGLHRGWFQGQPFPFLLKLVATVQRSMPVWDGTIKGKEGESSSSAISSMEVKAQGCALMLRYLLAVLQQDLAPRLHAARELSYEDNSKRLVQGSLLFRLLEEMAGANWKGQMGGKAELIRLLVDTILAAHSASQKQFMPEDSKPQSSRSTPTTAQKSGRPGSAEALGLAPRDDLCVAELGSLAAKLLSMMFEVYTAAEMCGCYLLRKGASTHYSTHDRISMDVTLLGLMMSGNVLSLALQRPTAFRALMTVLPPAAVVRFLCYLTAYKAFNRSGGGAINPMSTRVDPLKLVGPLLTIYDYYHTSEGQNDIEPSADAIHVLEFIAKDPSSRHKWGVKSILGSEAGFQAFLDALVTATAQVGALEPNSAVVTPPTAAAAAIGSKSKRAKLNHGGQVATLAAMTQQLMLSAANAADPSLLLVATPVRLASSGTLVKCGIERVRELHAQLAVAVKRRDDTQEKLVEDVSAAVSRRIAQRLIGLA